MPLKIRDLIELLDVHTWITIIDDATLELFSLGIWQIKVLSAHMAAHISRIGVRVATSWPGAAVREVIVTVHIISSVGLEAATGMVALILARFVNFM